MARIGSTFTADQQFESFTRVPAFLIGFCTAPVRPPHNIRNCVRRTGGIVRVEAMGAVGTQAAERAEPERDESPLCIEFLGSHSSVPDPRNAGRQAIERAPLLRGSLSLHFVDAPGQGKE
jgi:hypothetical protein